MNVKAIKVGALECNCYLLEIGQKVLIVDPGAEPFKIIEQIKDKTVLGILITHNHYDHIGALTIIQKEYRVPVYKKDCLEEREYNIGPFKFQVIFTFGHTSDSITYYFSSDEIMLTGDFLFKGTIGRCDLDGGSIDEMQKSLNKIKGYKDIIKVYPGHGESTILGNEKQNNPFLQ